MRITFELLGVPFLSDVIGKKKMDFEMEGSTVTDLFESIIAQWGRKAKAANFDSDGKFDPTIQIAINGEMFVPYDEHHVFLKAGDTVTFMILLGGA